MLLDDVEVAARVLTLLFPGAKSEAQPPLAFAAVKGAASVAVFIVGRNGEFE